MELALRVFLLVLLLDAPLFWFQRVPLQIVCGARRCSGPRSRATPATGPASPRSRAWPLVWNWPFSDNHDYLRALRGARRHARAHHGRAGGRAPHQRAAAGRRHLLLRDALEGGDLAGLARRHLLPRDAALGPALPRPRRARGRREWDDARRLRRRATGFLSGTGGWPGAFVEPPGLAPLALALTAFTAALEAGIALTFLWPRLARFRNALLIVFGATTFAFATVRGFGFLLMTLGLAQCEDDERRTRIAYIATLFLIEAYRSVPWTPHADRRAGALVQTFVRGPEGAERK